MDTTIRNAEREFALGNISAEDLAAQHIRAGFMTADDIFATFNVMKNISKRHSEWYRNKLQEMLDNPKQTCIQYAEVNLGRCYNAYHYVAFHVTDESKLPIAGNFCTGPKIDSRDTHPILGNIVYCSSVIDSSD